MITISDGILTIPEGERFVGFKGDNLHTQKKFFIRTDPASGWLYRLYLTFDDGRHNFFTLPYELYADGIVLTWDIEEDHIFKSGLVKAQIKAFSDDSEVYHTTSDIFVAGKATEEDEEFLNSNSEFVHFEKTLNELYDKMETASAKMPYVGTNGNWFTYDMNSQSYKDSGMPSAAGFEDMIIPPQKLDRRYWEHPGYEGFVFDEYMDLVDHLVNEDRITVAEFNLITGEGVISGICQVIAKADASGAVDWYIANLTTGEFWTIRKEAEGNSFTAQKLTKKLDSCIAQIEQIKEGKVNTDLSSYASLSPVADEDKLVYQCAEENALKSISVENFKKSLDYVCIALNSLEELYKTSFATNKKYLIKCSGSLAGEFSTNYCEATFVSSVLGEILTVIPVGNISEYYVVDLSAQTCTCHTRTIAFLENAPIYVANTQFAVSENVLTADKVVAASNWTKDDNSFTHSAGSAEPLRIAMGDLAVAGDEWLITFEYTDDNYADIMLEASFGAEAKTQCYNGTKDIAMALRVNADGDDLLITPVSRYSGTLSDFKIRKITEDGPESFEFKSDTIVNMDRQICKTGFWNVVLGTEHTLTNSPNSSRTIVIGHNALRQLRTGNRNIGIGTYAMSQMESGEQNIAIGADSMFEVKSAEGCITLGKGAMQNGTSLERNIAIGEAALNGSADSTASLNIALGYCAGYGCVGERNIFMGYNAAMSVKQGIANVFIGDQCVGTNGKNQNTVIGAGAKATGDANRSVAIGYQAQTTKANQCVIGGANISEFVFGTKKINFNDDGTVTWEEV